MSSTTATTATTVAHHAANHHIPASTVIAIAGIVVGLLIAVVREWFAARERRRARPVVITNEVRKRHFTDGMKTEVATVYLSNESTAAAFNIRFGVEMHGVAVPWKHDQADDKPNRVNVIRPGECWPKNGTVDIVIPDEALWAIGTERDPDEGRRYWAYYHSPAGEWWHTVNPADRTADLTIERISRRKMAQRDRELAARMQEGRAVFSDALRGLREGARLAGSGTMPAQRDGWESCEPRSIIAAIWPR